MLLEHSAIYEIENIEEVFDVKSVTALVKSIVSHGKKQDPLLYEPLSFMGDCWELFAEFFFKFFNGDHSSKSSATFTSDYKPNNDVDKGIDGRGISTLDGLPCVIQHKFKADPTTWLTNKDNISNVAAEAINEGVVPNSRNIIVFTSCKGVHPQHAMDTTAYCISINDIKKRVDGNVVFWDNLQKTLDVTLQTLAQEG